MLRKTVILSCVCCLLSLFAAAQTVFFLNAGSRANRGQQQELFIQRDGSCRYRLSEVNGAVKDSASFALLPGQLDSLFRKAEETGFFNLNKRYESGAADGAGIFISLNHNGRRHSVDLVNTDQPAVNQLVTLLNAMLAPRNIRINYGQFILPRNR